MQTYVQGVQGPQERAELLCRVSLEPDRVVVAFAFGSRRNARRAGARAEVRVQGKHTVKGGLVLCQCRPVDLREMASASVEYSSIHEKRTLKSVFSTSRTVFPSGM